MLPGLVALTHKHTHTELTWTQTEKWRMNYKHASLPCNQKSNQVYWPRELNEFFPISQLADMFVILTSICSAFWELSRVWIMLGSLHAGHSLPPEVLTHTCIFALCSSSGSFLSVWGSVHQVLRMTIFVVLSAGIYSSLLTVLRGTSSQISDKYWHCVLRINLQLWLVKSLLFV